MHRITAALTALAAPALLAAAIGTGPAAIPAASAAGPVPACADHAQSACF
jgi:hypothetical protein